MQTAISARRAVAIRLLIPVYLIVIVGVPVLAAATPIVLLRNPSWRVGAIVVAPAIYGVVYALLAGALSRFTLHAIVPGRYPRDLGHEVYGLRRLYALCWTCIYYFAPLYHGLLAVAPLKRAVFRLFGYRGSLAFQTYPDTWLRDLPLLTIGEGAYLSNKATVSPNMCLRSGKIVVLPVSIGAGTMIGHLAMVAPGADVGANSEVGVGAALGINVCVGSRTVIGHTAILDHDSVVGDNCVIGTRVYIGRKAVVRSGLRVPPAMVVPAESILSTQAEVDALAPPSTLSSHGTPASPRKPSSWEIELADATPPTLEHFIVSLNHTSTNRK